MRALALTSAPLTAALMIFATSPALADEIPGTSYASGYWEGAAQTNDRGEFSHCSVSVGYTGGAALWIGLYANDSLSVLLRHPNVRFNTGQTFDSWLMLETGLPIKGVSEAWDDAYAGMTLEGIDASISFLNQGQYLRLLGIGIDESHDVSGISEALALARDCHATQTAGSPGADVPIPQANTIIEPRTGTTIGIEDGGALGTPVPKPSP